MARLCVFRPVFLPDDIVHTRRRHLLGVFVEHFIEILLMISLAEQSICLRIADVEVLGRRRGCRERFKFPVEKTCDRLTAMFQMKFASNTQLITILFCYWLRAKSKRVILTKEIYRPSCYIIIQHLGTLTIKRC